MPRKIFRRGAIRRSVRVEVEEGDFTILPSTNKYINTILRRAAKAGTIKSPDEVITSRIGLTAAAIKAAQVERSKRVSIRHLDAGWNNFYAYGGNCPPHLCLRRSILERRDNLENSDPVFRLVQKTIKG